MAAGSSNKGIDYYRRFFSLEKCNIFEIIEFGIMLASVDCPNEFRLRRDRIAELLFSCESKRCVGCEHVEFCVDNNDDDLMMMKSSEGSRDVVSYGDVVALNEETEEEESQLVDEVLRIKVVLSNVRNESDKELYDSLTRLQFMAFTVDILKATEIGKAVNGLRKHSSSDVRHLVKLLIQGWKEMVDKWVNATKKIVEANEGTPDSINPSVLDEEEGLPSPPMDEGAFFATPQTMELSQFFDGMDDDGNLRNSGEFSKNYPTQRKSPNDNQIITKRKLHPNTEHTNVSQPKRLPVAQSGPGRPQKSQTRGQLNHQQELDKVPSQRKPLSGDHDNLKPPVGNLETMTKRLQESYQEAENAKRQRTIQVLDTIPKQGVSHLKKPSSRNGNLNRQRLLGRPR